MNVTFAPSKSKLALTIAGCLAFTAIAVFLLVSGPTVGEALGAVLCIVFFGGGGVLFVAKLTRTTTTLTLTPAGLHPMSGGLVPWDDYDGVGLGRVSGALIIGIRLRSYDAFIASLTPTQIMRAAHAGRAGKLFGAVTKPLIGRSNPGTASLANIPEGTEGMAGLLAWSRDTSGYELSFSSLLFDRPAAQVIQAIADYQAGLESTAPEGAEKH
jgi:hypothetical protein